MIEQSLDHKIRERFWKLGSSLSLSLSLFLVPAKSSPKQWALSR